VTGIPNLLQFSTFRAELRLSFINQGLSVQGCSLLHFTIPNFTPQNITQLYHTLGWTWFFTSPNNTLHHTTLQYIIILWIWFFTLLYRTIRNRATQCFTEQHR